MSKASVQAQFIMLGQTVHRDTALVVKRYHDAKMVASQDERIAAAKAKRERKAARNLKGTSK